MQTLFKLTILVSFFISTTQARVDQFIGFNFSMSHRYLIDTSHLEAIEDNVRLATPSLLQEWGVIGASAEAHYNDYLNLVVVDKDKVKNGAVKSYFDFKSDKEGYIFTTFASTLFHELAHADYDVFIEEEDTSFRFLLNTMLKNWVKRNVKGHSNKIVRHEILGYTADGIIQVLDMDIDKVLFHYGYVFSQDRCMKKSSLVKKAKLLQLERGFKLVNHWDKTDYAERVSPLTVFVKGEDVDLESLNFPRVFKSGIFNYFQKTYKLPRNRDELVKKLNQSHWLKKVRRCYEEII